MRQRSVRKRPHVRPEAVLQVALEILDSEGFEGVTFRAIAGRLGIQAPALYWHFENKRDLLDDLAEVILAQGGVGAIHAPAKAGGWKEWLGEAARTLRTALMAHRDGGRIVAGASFLRAKSLARLAITSTQVLRDAGFPMAEASVATATVIDYVWGFVIEEQAGEGPSPSGTTPGGRGVAPGHELDSLLRDLGMDPSIAPSFREIMESRGKLSDAQMFGWGLNAILDGLAFAKKAGRRASVIGTA